jgi:poly(3-hydroxybutyrate) depolymerase
LEFSGDAGGDRAPQEPEGATPSKIALELDAVRLRDFTMAESGVPTLLCTPLSLHGAAIADLAAGHSLVAALRGAGTERLFMADWRSASADMRFLGIDEYLADLNVLVDCVGGLVDLIGLCQAGWLSLVYAGRFPAKVRKLVMAGAPVDIAARQSRLSAIAEATPLILFQSLVNLGNGRVIGRNIAQFWETTLTRAIFANPCRRFSRSARQNSRGSKPSSRPGILGQSTFPEHTISKLSRNYTSATNSPAEASSPWGKRSTSRACGFQCIFLVGAPTKLVAPEQLLAVERLVGTQPEDLRHEVAPCNHLGLFMGRRTLEEYWPRIVRWMREVD